MNCHGADGVIMGTPPGTFLRVCLECVCFVSFSILCFVGLVAIIIDGASVIHHKVLSFVGTR